MKNLIVTCMVCVCLSGCTLSDQTTTLNDCRNITILTEAKQPTEVKTDIETKVENKKTGNFSTKRVIKNKPEKK